MSWQQVRGHERLVSAFAGVVQRGRLGHAYLFVGPPGVGKKLFATELARALLCEGPAALSGQLQACGQCAACKLVTAGSHPDLFLVQRPEDSNEMKIEVMRELCQKFSLKSARGRGKVAIVDDADDLNDASANCFLKTLEEPPPRSVFLLIGSSRDQQLPTILSRCQVVRFAPLPDALLADLLRERGVADAALLERLLRLCAGSPGQALALADPELWQFRQNLLQTLSERPFHPVALSKDWLEFTEQAGKELSLQRRRLLLILHLLTEFLRDALALSVGGAPRVQEAAEEQLLQSFRAGRSPERLMELIERCLEAENQVRRYIQLVLIVEGLVDALAV